MRTPDDITESGPTVWPDGCYCSPALTNQDRWRHFCVFSPLQTRPRAILKPDRGSQVILHNSILQLLEALLPGNQMFCLCNFILVVFLSDPHSHPAHMHSNTCFYRRNCITDIHLGLVPLVHHEPQNASCSLSGSPIHALAIF